MGVRAPRPRTLGALLVAGVLGMAVLAATQWLDPSDPPRVSAGQPADVTETTTVPDAPASTATAAPDHIVDTAAAVSDGPIDTHPDHKLSCQGEMMASIAYDSPAGSGFATPEEAFEETLAEIYPQAPANFRLTERNRVFARIENDRGAFLVALLGDGLWHMDQSSVCASTGSEWVRGSVWDRRG